MEDLILDIVSSYETKISTIEDIFNDAYQVTIAWDDYIEELGDERERLKSTIRELLAQNCSLRRKDFNQMVRRILGEYNEKKENIEQKRKELIKQLSEYISKQKSLTASLKEQVMQLASGKIEKDSLETTISALKSLFQNDGEKLIAQLRSFQIQLTAFQREQEEINRKMERLVERGNSLRIEDLRELEAAEAREKRKMERQLRLEEVERYLSQCRKQRHEIDLHKL
jgi:chromosome segregation ATPase